MDRTITGRRGPPPRPALQTETPRLDVNALKRENPIERVAASYGVQLHQRGQKLMALCPFHSEKTPSFTVDPVTGRWRCYGRCCFDGQWRDVIDFIGLKEFGSAWNPRDKTMFWRAVAVLGGQAQVRLAARPAPPRPAAPKLEVTPDVLYLLNKTARLYHAALKAAGTGPGTPRGYLLGRGFTEATIDALRLGYCPGHGRNVLLQTMQDIGFPVEVARSMRLIDPEHGDREFLAGRIIFPCLDAHGRVIHLAGRKWAPWLGKKSPKYLSLWYLPKPIYGYERVTPDGSGPVLITESLPDWATLLQWGYEAVGLLGTALTPRHAEQLRRLPRRLVFVPQNDESGVGQEAVAAWRQMVGRGEILVFPAGVKDVNDLALAGRRGEFTVALAAALA